MAGNKKKRKTAQNPPQNDRVVKKIKQDEELKAVDADVPTLGGLLFTDEIETTVDTLNILCRHPELISQPALKGFRTAVHDYWRLSSETSMTGKFIPVFLSIWHDLWAYRQFHCVSNLIGAS